MFSTEAFRITTPGGVGTAVTLRGTVRAAEPASCLSSSRLLRSGLPAQIAPCALRFCACFAWRAPPSGATAGRLRKAPRALPRAPTWGGTAAAGARAEAGAQRGEPRVWLGARGRCRAACADAGEPERRDGPLPGAPALAGFPALLAARQAAPCPALRAATRPHAARASPPPSEQCRHPQSSAPPIARHAMSPRRPPFSRRSWMLTRTRHSR